MPLETEKQDQGGQSKPITLQVKLLVKEEGHPHPLLPKGNQKSLA